MKEHPKASERQNKRLHVALPIRVTYWDDAQKPCLEIACTYDISEHGARVTGLRNVKEAGEVIAIERGKSKAFCRVVWVGEPNSELQGQIGLQCVESDRILWEAELRDMVETYEPVMPEATRNGLVRSPPMNVAGAASVSVWKEQRNWLKRAPRIQEPAPQP